MGFEAIVIETDANINLSDLYRVKEDVEDVFDWYLGSDIKEKRSKFDELREKAAKLTRQEISDALVAKYGPDSPKCAMFNSIPEDDVARYVKFLSESTGEFHENNSHLFFEWEKLPGKDLSCSCSYTFHELLSRCEFRVYKNSVSELDIYELKQLAKKMKGYSFKFHLTKWIGYFLPDAACRMVFDMCKNIGVEMDYCQDIDDLIYYKDELNNIVDSMDPEKRLWLVSSY